MKILSSSIDMAAFELKPDKRFPVQKMDDGRNILNKKIISSTPYLNTAKKIRLVKNILTSKN